RAVDEAVIRDDERRRTPRVLIQLSLIYVEDRPCPLLIPSLVKGGVQPQEVLHTDPGARRDALIPPRLGAVDQLFVILRCEKKPGSFIVPKQLKGALHPVSRPVKIPTVQSRLVQ